MNEKKMDIRALLQEGGTFFFDGAMGTYYADLPEREQVRCEEANLLHAAEIMGIHRAYLEAGAMALKTNTYGLSEDFAFSHTVAGETMLRAGCRLAKNAAADYDALVFGDIGPAPDGGAFSPAECYIRQAELFAAARRRSSSSPMPWAMTASRATASSVRRCMTAPAQYPRSMSRASTAARDRIIS